MKKSDFDEIVFVRTGEPLEATLNERGMLKAHQEKLRSALQKLKDTQESRAAFESVENAFAEYSSFYANQAYRLGISDGIEIGKEQKLDHKKTILSYEDMVTLVKIYDAVKELNTTLLGSFTVYPDDMGVLGTLECIVSVIEHGVCERLRLLHDEELTECLAGILDDDSSTVDKRVKQLLGVAD